MKGGLKMEEENQTNEAEKVIEETGEAIKNVINTDENNKILEKIEERKKEVEELELKVDKKTQELKKILIEKEFTGKGYAGQEIKKEVVDPAKTMADEIVKAFI
jgi:uncharacterized protein Yka (UPF0111/DUF47 family)